MRRTHSDATRRRRTLPVGRIIFVAVAIACWLSTSAEAQPIEEPKTYAGDLWSRPRLTGDWGGFRDEMARRGIRLDVDVLLIPTVWRVEGATPGLSFGATPSTRSTSIPAKPACGPAASC